MINEGGQQRREIDFMWMINCQDTMKNYSCYDGGSCTNCIQQQIVYDNHHDEVFCMNCGLVLYQAGTFLLH